jgi:hypothetical protein
MTLKINQNFKSIITNLLINSNKLNFKFQLFNNKLLIDKRDYEEVDKLLTRHYHNYKVL